MLAAVTCATDAKMARTGAHPALGPLPGGAGPRGGRDGGRGRARASPGRAPGRRGRGRQLGPVRRMPRLPRRAAEPVRATWPTSPGPSPSACACPRAIVARNVHRLPAGLPPRPSRRWRSRSRARSTPPGGPGPWRGRLVLVLGGGFQGRMLAGLLARRGRAGAPGRPAPGAAASAARAAGARPRTRPRATPPGADAAARRRSRRGGGRPGGRGRRAAPRPGRSPSPGPRGRRGADARRLPGGFRGEPADPPDSLFGGHDPRRHITTRPDAFAKRCEVLSDPPFPIADALVSRSRWSGWRRCYRCHGVEKHPVIPV